MITEIKDFAQIFRDIGLKLTPQRMEIIKDLYEFEHSNIDEIYKRVKIKYPYISITTLYRTIEVLLEKGKIKYVGIDKTSRFFDIKLEQHHHIICKRCNKIENILPVSSCVTTCLPQYIKDNYEGIEAETCFTGTCKNCLKLKLVKIY
jgi:Fur family peroxide stress response transcriptional regulator